jgi:hypothetical protein
LLSDKKRPISRFERFEVVGVRLNIMLNFFQPLILLAKKKTVLHESRFDLFYIGCKVTKTLTAVSITRREYVVIIIIYTQFVIVIFYS